MKKGSIHTSTAIITKISKDIVEKTVLENSQLNLYNVQENFAKCQVIIGVPKAKLLIIGENGVGIEKDARQWAVKNLEWTSSIALVTSSTLHRFIFNYFIIALGKKMKMRVFNEKEKAIEWLYSL